MEKERIKVRITQKSPYSEYGYYERGDIGYIDGYVNSNAVIILENGKFAKADLRWIEVVNEEDNNVFPELKESKDEMIKEMLIEQMKRWHEMAVANNVIKDIKDSADAIVWLEKQVEQKPVPKFKIGDTMRTLQEAKDGWTDGMPFVVSIDSEYYNCNSEKIAIKDQDEYEYPPMNRKHDICDSCDEQKPADKVEPKFKVKYAGSEYNVLEVKNIAGVAFYGIEDEPNHIDYVKAENCEIISGYGIKENGSPYPTKPAVFSEQKPAWSEGDDIYIENIILAVEKQYPIAAKEIVEWLKSLKERVGKFDNGYKVGFSAAKYNQWKPSDAQIASLTIVCDRNDRIGFDLTQLLRDLKKLREE